MKALSETARAYRQAAQDRAPHIDQVMTITRAAMFLTHRMDELLYGCDDAADVIDALVEAGAWITDADVCPVTDWINIVMPRLFDDAECRYAGSVTSSFESGYRGSVSLVHLRIGNTTMELDLPYLLGEVVRHWDGGSIPELLDAPGEYGFDVFYDLDGVTYGSVRKPAAVA